MTTTAVQTPGTIPQRGRDVMAERIEVDPRRGGKQPSRADACRVGSMRRITAARLRFCGLEEMIDDVTVIISELLTNAVIHSGTSQIGISIVVRDDGFLRLAIADGMPDFPEPKPVEEGAESGRGLHVVDCLVRENGGSWGVTEDRTIVWCLLCLGEGR
ncbi:ATP-binding protein [Streptomyces sp. SCSIO 30461]|uniref:ATP-binding protein n=1 Tax=Streptomyces sp. SCSIO 30461 TaxID=3118085 RepID=UPI0030D12019